MATLLYRIGRFAARRGIAVIVGWVVILGLFVGGAQLLGGTLASSFEIPGTESQQAIDMLDQRFPQASGGSAKVIYVAPSGGQIADHQAQIDDNATKLAALDHVSGVTDPWSQNASGQINDDGTMAFTTIQYDVPTTALTPQDDQDVVDIGNQAAVDGVTVAYSNVADPPAEGIDYTEAIGLVVAFIVLLITFGSLLAAGMPLVTAVIGVAVTTTTITIASGFVDISSTAPLLATMLGLAVGIDYALFIVSRHRAQLIRGLDPKESAAIAVSTAGSAVVFAALTVIIALLGLSVVQIPFLTVMGLGAAISVVVAVIVALTLLPAILGLLGKRLIPKPTSRAARRELAADGTHRTMGARWVRLITAKPVITVGVVVIGLGIVAIPAGSMSLTLPDAGYDPPGSQSREGYDLLTEGFGPGFNGPLLITADISKTLDITGALDALHDQFVGLADVDSVSQAIPNSTVDMAIVSIIPDSGPDDTATKDLVQTIREMAPAFEEKNGFSYQVTGTTALGIDVSARLAAALVPFGIVVVGLCIILLTIVFRSLAVPLSATVGYLLSVGASFGIVTAVFEWGWLADLLGVAKVGPVISFFPILLMAVLFGLAMDYQVFLVSRMREEHVKGADPHTAVRHGFIGAARVVTAAACIMFAVFASFVPGGSAVLQPIALGLAAGVFIDAFIVRMTFIPALMMLLGKWAWALPRALGRVLPNVDLEGEGVREMLDATAWRPLDEGEHPFAVAAEHAVVDGSAAASFALRAEPGDLVIVTGAASTHPDAVVAAIAGRQRVLSGHLRVLDQALPFQAAALRRHSVLVERPVEAEEPTLRLALPPGALSVLERLRRDLGEEVGDLWGPAVAAEWTYQLALAAVSKARLVAVDGSGVPTAHLQHALGIVQTALPLATTVVVAHHGARLEMGVRRTVVVELRPAPLVPEPVEELAPLVPAPDALEPAADAVAPGTDAQNQYDDSPGGLPVAPENPNPTPSNPTPSNPTPSTEKR